jgi:hypothetical protein
MVDQVHGAWTGWRGSGPPWTEVAWTRGHDGALLVHSARALGLIGAHRRWWRRTSRTRRVGGVLTGARATTKRRHDRGKERQWLELVAREKECAKELMREGKRGGEDRGLS